MVQGKPEIPFKVKLKNAFSKIVQYATGYVTLFEVLFFISMINVLLVFGGFQARILTTFASIGIYFIWQEAVKQLVTIGKSFGGK